MTESPVGRPTIMTPEVVNKLEEAFLLGCSDIEACFYAKISKQTLYNYQDAHPEFVDRKEELKNNPTFIARRTVVNDIATNSDLALKYLERKKKDEFSTKSESDITTKGQPINLNAKDMEILKNAGISSDN